MAAYKEKRELVNMISREGNGERADQGVNLPAKTKNSSARIVSPYAKRSTTQRQECKTPSNTIAGALSKTRKAKMISRSPSHKPTCTSAPATIVRLPGMRQPATNPPPKAKQGTCSISIGVPGERRSAPLTQPHHQRQTTYMMVPVRLKKAGLKLLDPEKVKNLTSLAAAKHFEPGEETLHSHPPSAQVGKPCSLNSRHRAVLRFPAKQIPPSRKSTGILGRRQESNPSTKHKGASGDMESHLLTRQIDALVLNEKDGSESSSCSTGQKSDNSLIPPQPNTNQQIVIQHDETDSSSLEATNNNNPLEVLNLPTMSTTKEEAIVEDVKEDLECATKKKVIQEQLLEDKELDSELHPSSKEDHGSVGLQLEETSDDLTQADALNDLQGDTGIEKQSQEDFISSHGHLKKSPRVKTISPMVNDSTDERCASFSVEEGPLVQNVPINFGQSSSPTEENMGDMGASSNQEDTKSQISLRMNDFIRKSQGVLVLTRSTDENAIFIPKLKFEFTPDNSIDWTAFPQPLSNNHGVKEKDPRITKPCTPRGPSFSKSVLRKSSAFQGYAPTAGNSESNPGAERSTKDSSHPLHGIVDLSISFQGKYEGDEIPNDIPRILLTEGDSDED